MRRLCGFRGPRDLHRCIFGNLRMNSPAEAISVDRRSTWGLLLAGVFVVGLFAPTFQQLVHIWLLDANYSHGFFIAPICLWLAWRLAREHPLPERGDAVQG